MRQIRGMLAGIATTGVVLATAPGLAAQTLRGSHASVELMYDRARAVDLEFFTTPEDIYKAVAAGRLKLISFTDDVALDKTFYPFVLPRALDFITKLGAQYHASCGDRLTVTSGTRPTDKQPRNASPESVHPTGMAVDFHKPPEPCLTWLRQALLALEAEHVIEATEERHPPHFHVAVLSASPTQYAVKIDTRSAAPKSDTVRVEQSKVAWGAGGEVASAAAAATDNGSSTYRVRPGDNLWALARRNHTTVERLKDINKLRSDELRAGQELRIR